MRKLFIVISIVVMILVATAQPISAASQDKVVDLGTLPDGTYGAASDSNAARETSRIIEVKFRDGQSIRVRGGALTGLSPTATSQFARLLRDYPAASVRPVFTLPEERLTQLRLEGERLSVKQLPDLNLWFRITLRDGADIDAFVRELKSVDGVEIVQELPFPAPPPATTPDFRAQQGYEGVAPEGIGARLAWTVSGGTGGNVTIFDIEYNWLQTHEDLDAANGVALLLNAGDSNSPPGFPGCPAPCDAMNREHGTAVLGEIISTNDALGVTGIAFNSPIGLAPANTTNLGYNPANAIALATTAAGANATAGDVILIEQQANVCGLANGSFGPLEGIASVRAAIVTAVANGVIVIEAAGNGNVDLDQAACGTTFSNANDSGAIIVGAGQSPGTGNDRQRSGFSSFGQTVDLQGWGNGVRSAGYGTFYVDPDNPADATRWYTTFSGTSSASPIVAGAAALLQSIAIQNNGAAMTPAQIRNTLVNTGSPQQGNTAQNIGPRPNLAASIASILDADVGVTKSDSPDPVTAGTNLTYTLIVTNGGPGIALNATLADTTPANTTFVSLTAPAGWSCTTPAVGGTGPVNCSNPALANGANHSFTFVVKVNANTPNGTTLSNTATVSADNNVNASNDSVTATTAVITSADLSVNKTDSPDPVIAGTDETYNITVTNNGPSDAQNVTLTDATPANTTFVSFAQNTGPAFTCTTPSIGGTGNVSCTTATLPAGASATFSFVVHVSPSAPDGSTLSNTVSAAASTTDPNPANNSKTITTAVTTSADLSVSKSQTRDLVIADTNETYHLTVTNNGPSDAQNVTLTDPTPANTTFVSFVQNTGPAFTCITPPVGGTGDISCTIPTLALGASANFRLVVRVSPVDVSSISNTASVLSSTTDSNPGNNSATVTAEVSVRKYKQNILTDLITLRDTVTDKQDGKKLDDAIKHLNRSLNPSWWLTDNTLMTKHGKKVFLEEKNAVVKLSILIQNNDSGISDILRTLVRRLVAADRALADIAIHQAISAGGDTNQIAQARKELARGNSDVNTGKYIVAIQHYRNAWQHAQKAMNK